MFQFEIPPVSSMLGIIIYLIVQVALFGFAVHVIVNREEIKARHANRKDTRWEKIIIVFIVPIGSFAYFSLGGFPPKDDRLIMATVMTVFMYGVVIARWIRQSRIPSNAALSQAEKLYYYRSGDGTAVCGPENERKLATLVRLGLITEDTAIADEHSPNVWNPLRDRTDLLLLRQSDAN